MIGLKMKVPPANFVEAALDQKLLVIPAGDNVVRVMPPPSRHRRGDRGRRVAARRGLRRRRGAPDRGDKLIERRMNAPVHTAPRHFLDLLELSSGELRGILDKAAAMKATRVKGAEPASASARRARRWR